MKEEGAYEYDPYKKTLERKLMSIREICYETLHKPVLEDDEIYFLIEMILRECR